MGWLAAVVLGGLILPCSLQRAAAEPRKRVAVLAFESDMLIDSVAKSLRRAVSDAIEARPDWELRETEVSLAQLSFAHDCSPSAPDCLRSITRQFQLDSLVFGRLSHNGEEIVVRLSRFDAAAAGPVRTADAAFMRGSLSAEGLAWQGRALASELFDAGALRMQAELSEPSRAAHLPPTAAQSDTGGVSGRAVAAYSALAVAAVAAGLSAYSFLQIERAQNDAGFEAYRRAVGSMQPQVEDVCAEAARGVRYDLSASELASAQSSCGRGNTFEVLQFVFLGSALLSGGLGAYLLLSEGSEHPTSPRSRAGAAWSLQPSLGRRGAGLRAKWRWQF